MKLANTTTIPSVTVRQILLFVAPPGVASFSVRLTNARGYTHAGRAYCERNHVALRVGAETLFPKPPRRPVREKRGYLPTPWFADRTEALVHLAAHELRHLWQYRVPRGRRVWGSRGQYSERDADAYALRMLRAWRRTVRPESGNG